MNTSELLKLGAAARCTPVNESAFVHCGLRNADAEILRTVGLPIEESIFDTRFEQLRVVHTPLVYPMTDIQQRFSIPVAFVQSDSSESRLEDLVALGSICSDSAKAITDVVVLHRSTGRIGWFSLPGQHSESEIVYINSSLPAYIFCMLAYNDYYNERVALGENSLNPEDIEYQSRAKQIMSAFVTRLNQADKESSEGGFWGIVRGDEELLLELNFSDSDNQS